MSFESDVVGLLPVLSRYARALTGDAAWADDLVQDTAEHALSRWRLWRSDSNLRAWLLTILRNLFLDQLRQQRKTTTTSFDESDEWRVIAAGQEAIDGLLLRDVQRALYRLPVDQREVLLLVGLEELSYREAARVLKVPVGTVMSRLSRARQQMHSLMTEQGPDRSERPALKVVRNTP